MESFGEKLKRARGAKNVRQSELAALLAVRTSTISNWENNVSRPDLPALERLCARLEVEPGYFFAQSPKAAVFSPEERELIERFRTLDEHARRLVSAVLEIEAGRCRRPSAAPAPRKTIDLDYYLLPASAGTGVYLDGDYKETVQVADTPLARRADYAVRVSGDSMEPLFSDSDLLLVEARQSVDHGEIGIFVLNNEGYVKRLYQQGRQCRLVSLNRRYADLIVHDSDTLVCRGRVLGKAPAE